MEVLRMKECSRGFWRREDVLCDRGRKEEEEEEECLPVRGGQLFSSGSLMTTPQRKLLHRAGSRGTETEESYSGPVLQTTPATNPRSSVPKPTFYMQSQYMSKSRPRLFS